MTPRYRLVALDVDDPLDESFRKMAASPHQVFPVYEGDLDRLLGMAPVKSLWAASLSGDPIDLRALTEPALIVPESMPAWRCCSASATARATRRWSWTNMEASRG